MMLRNPLIISQLGLAPDHLRGEVAIVSGAGGGIGYEAARALLWLGATVVLAEVNRQSGARAAYSLASAFGPQRVIFLHTDVGNERSVHYLLREAQRNFGKVDILLNNATLAPLGAVSEVPIRQWDASYRANLRGPVLLAQACLPGMLTRNHGCFVCVSSSGTAFLGAYECLKAAQVHLASTLDAELQESAVHVFTIGPGLVPTPTAQAAVQQLAPRLGMSVADFYRLNQQAMLSVEEAGAGFAAAIALAQQFRGQEISALQALRAANPAYGRQSELAAPAAELPLPGSEQRQRAATRCRQVYTTLLEQAEGWKQRSLFERQWVIRDFKKVAGAPVEEWLGMLVQLEAALQDASAHTIDPPPLARLAEYYAHLADLAQGYEQDPARLQEHLCLIRQWQAEVSALQTALAVSGIDSASTELVR